MSNNFIIWGCSGHAKVLLDILKLEGSTVVAFFDNDLSVNSLLSSVPIYHGEEGFKKWKCENVGSYDTYSLLVAIGGDRGKDREDILKKITKLGVSTPTVIHKDASVSPNSKIGSSCQVLSNVMVASGVEIGSNTILNNSANIDHDCILGKGVHIAPGAVLCGCIFVNDYAFVGAGSVILPRLSIGKGAVIGAGSVVTRDVPDNVVVAGNPAKIII